MHVNGIPVNCLSQSSYEQFNGTEFFWKPLSKVIEDYINHPQSKFEGDIGVLQRKHLKISKYSLRYLIKESNNIEIAEIIGVQEDDCAFI